MDKECGNCKNFRIHYIKYVTGNYQPLYSGHCVKPRVKTRTVDSKACLYWEEETNTEEHE